MFIFTGSPDFLNKVNPTTATQVTLSLDITPKGKETSIYKLFETSAIYAKTEELTKEQYEGMNFHQDPRIQSF